MKWFLIIVLFFVTNVVAEDSILIDKKSIVNQVNEFNSLPNAKGSPKKAQNKELSDHYKAHFEKLLTLDISERRTNALKAINMLINASLELEAGAITQDQFSSIEREATILYSSEPSKKNNPEIENTDSLKAILQQNKPTNCISTTSGNTVFTKCN